MAHVQRRDGNWIARHVGPDGRERSKTFRRKFDADRYLGTCEYGWQAPYYAEDVG